MNFKEMEKVAKAYNDLNAKREKLAEENYRRREEERFEALRTVLEKPETVELLNILLGEKECQRHYGRNGGFKMLMDYDVRSIEFDVRVVNFGNEECYPSDEDYAAADKELGIEA